MSALLVPAASSASAAPAAAAVIPFKPVGERGDDLIGTGWIAVVLLLLAAVAALALWKRRFALRPGGRTDVIATVRQSLRLDERTRLSVVEFEGQRLLVAHAPGVPAHVLTRAPLADDKAVP